MIQHYSMVTKNKMVSNFLTEHFLNEFNPEKLINNAYDDWLPSIMRGKLISDLLNIINLKYLVVQKVLYYRIC